MSCRILVVDDSSTIQKIFKIALSRYAVDVVGSSTFLEALNQSTRSKSDLLVVDANLPGIKGPKEILQLQQENHDAPVLMLVGSHEPYDESAFRAAGIEQFLKKPFEAQDIVSAVSLVLKEELSLKAGNDAPQGFPSRPGPVNLPPPPGQMGSMPSASYALEHSITRGVPPPPPPIPNILTQHHQTEDQKSPFEIDQARRGRKAFQEPEPYSERPSFSSPEDDMPDTVMAEMPRATTEVWKDQLAANHGYKVKVDDEARQIEELKGKLEDFLRGEAPVVVRKAVEKYCEAHFAQLAKDVLTTELRRLAEEKSRLLSN